LGNPENMKKKELRDQTTDVKGKEISSWIGGMGSVGREKVVPRGGVSDQRKSKTKARSYREVPRKKSWPLRGRSRGKKRKGSTSFQESNSWATVREEDTPNWQAEKVFAKRGEHIRKREKACRACHNRKGQLLSLGIGVMRGCRMRGWEREKAGGGESE